MSVALRFFFFFSFILKWFFFIFFLLFFLVFLFVFIFILSVCSWFVVVILWFHFLLGHMIENTLFINLHIINKMLGLSLILILFIGALNILHQLISLLF